MFYHDSPGIRRRRGAHGGIPQRLRNKTYETSDLCWGPAADIVEEARRKENEEDIRLLYVAMTR